ncbi:hypothetical protein P280DRAFT_548568 [Massarina eburnea CBS 473.64]|uniref:Uncharacterized protein n=1 Tax=Massarina eburnea CBS 473.64 TaxID=1395130 RepID=A0A6A6S5G3_9PLEO|nr:hypothetical protein P280DRAFT_548568 [Massarina eburnea CBS 473.64]
MSRKGAKSHVFNTKKGKKGQKTIARKNQNTVPTSTIGFELTRTAINVPTPDLDPMVLKPSPKTATILEEKTPVPSSPSSYHLPATDLVANAVDIFNIDPDELHLVDETPTKLSVDDSVDILRTERDLIFSFFRRAENETTKKDISDILDIESGVIFAFVYRAETPLVGKESVDVLDTERDLVLSFFSRAESESAVKSTVDILGIERGVLFSFFYRSEKDVVVKNAFDALAAERNIIYSFFSRAEKDLVAKYPVDCITTERYIIHSFFSRAENELTTKSPIDILTTAELQTISKFFEDAEAAHVMNAASKDTTSSSSRQVESNEPITNPHPEEETMAAHHDVQNKPSNIEAQEIHIQKGHTKNDLLDPLESPITSSPTSTIAISASDRSTTTTPSSRSTSASTTPSTNTKPTPLTPSQALSMINKMRSTTIGQTPFTTFFEQIQNLAVRPKANVFEKYDVCRAFIECAAIEHASPGFLLPLGAYPVTKTTKMLWLDDGVKEDVKLGGVSLWDFLKVVDVEYGRKVDDVGLWEAWVEVARSMAEDRSAGV